MHAGKCGEQLGRDPSKNGSSRPLVLKGFSGEETLWDSSLLVRRANDAMSLDFDTTSKVV